MADPKSQISDLRVRWFQPTPDRFVIGMFVATCFLGLSERLQWSTFNQHKGWTVLIAVAGTAAGFVIMLLWFLASLLLRRPFQFGIRSLLVLAVVVAIPCGWLAAERARTREIRDAAAMIRRTGGDLVYNYGRPGAPGSEWLRRFLGEELFGDIYGIYWCGSKKLTDDDLQYFRPLDRIDLLVLNDTGITDAGLVHLRGLTQLESLSLFETSITDAGVESLERLHELKYLDIEGTQVSDEGVKRLRVALPKCEIVR